MIRKRLLIGLALSCLLILGTAPAVAAKPKPGGPTITTLATGLQGGSGSAVGPGGALYVTEREAGRVSRVNPRTGAVTTYASGLPPSQTGFGFGGPVDIAFHGSTAYVLVTLVGGNIGGDDVVGIYRVDGPNQFTVIADIGQWSTDNPPSTSYFVDTGVQYSIEPFRGGFLIADGHHNRVLHVTRDGEISEVIAFGNIVPTGLTVSGNTIYLSQAGPVPHNDEDGKVVKFGPNSSTATDVASGASLLVDVEFGHGHTLYALSQGESVPGAPEGSPAAPDTGALVRVDGTGFDVVCDELDRPTSLEFIGNTAYIVTYAGEIKMIANPHQGGACSQP